ncbi:hypothetical protein [Viridibacillus arvi]|uniref:hypothetical protein n=1 Tax=Viridibacillus arvi TaxID=263475 RepID=UPI0034CEFFFC
MKIREIQNVRYVAYVGAKIEVDKVNVYEGFGISLYRNGIMISFIEMDVIDVVEMEENYNGHQYYIKPISSNPGVYLYKEIPTLKIRINDRIVKNGDDSIKMLNLSLHEKELKERFADIDIPQLKIEYIWTVIEILDKTIAKIERNGVTEMALIKDVISLEELEKSIEFYKLHMK